MNIIVTGNPVDGFGYTGPFDNAHYAIEWAEENCKDGFWVAELGEPE